MTEWKTKRFRLSNRIAEALVKASHDERMDFMDALVHQWRAENNLLDSDLMKWAYRNSSMEVLMDEVP